MIEFLQFFHAHLVHLRDGSQRFAFRDDVIIAALRGFRRLGRGRACGRRGRRFSDDDAKADGGNLLLEFQNLLRQRIDLRVLLVDLFHQGFEQRLVRLIARRRLGRCRGANRRRQQKRKNATGEAFHGGHLGIEAR